MTRPAPALPTQEPVRTARERAAVLLREAGLDPVNLLAAADPDAPTIEAYVEGAWRRLMESRVRPPASSPRTYASDLGHGCDRYLVYRRTQGENASTHGPELEGIFALGRVHERELKLELQEARLEVLEAELRFEDRELEVSGRSDLTIPHRGVHWILDAKSMNSAMFARIRSVADLFDAAQTWLRKYPAQVAFYARRYRLEYPTRTARCGLILRSKDTGEPRVLALTLEDEARALEGLEPRLRAVAAHVAAGTLPDRVDSEAGWCERCAFHAVCGPDEPLRDPLKVTSDAHLIASLDRLAELEDGARERDRLDKAVKARLKKTDAFARVLAGRHLITRSERKDGVAVFRITRGGEDERDESES